MPCRAERRPYREVGEKQRHGGHLASSSPRRRYVAGKRARCAEYEIADSDVACGDQTPGRLAYPDHEPQITLADIRTDHMRRDTDEKPTPPTQSALSGADYADEYRNIRPPLTIIEPKQAGREDAIRLSAQATQVGRIRALYS